MKAKPATKQVAKGKARTSKQEGASIHMPKATVQAIATALKLAGSKHTTATARADNVLNKADNVEARAFIMQLAENDKAEWTYRYNTLGQSVMGKDYTAVAWNGHAVWSRMKRAFKRIGFTVPTARAKTKAANAERAKKAEALKVRAIEEVNKRLPKAKGAARDAAVAAALDNLRDAAKERAAELAFIDKSAATITGITKAMPDKITADCRTVQAHFVEGIKMLRALAPQD